MNAINSSFIVLCTLLVLLMTPALAMFYSGMVRSKNTLKYYNELLYCFWCYYFTMGSAWI